MLLNRDLFTSEEQALLISTEPDVCETEQHLFFTIEKNGKTQSVHAGDFMLDVIGGIDATSKLNSLDKIITHTIQEQNYKLAIFFLFALKTLWERIADAESALSEDAETKLFLTYLELAEYSELADASVDCIAFYIRAGQLSLAAQKAESTAQRCLVAYRNRGVGLFAHVPLEKVKQSVVFLNRALWFLETAKLCYEKAGDVVSVARLIKKIQLALNEALPRQTGLHGQAKYSRTRSAPASLRL